MLNLILRDMSTYMYILDMMLVGLRLVPSYPLCFLVQWNGSPLSEELHVLNLWNNSPLVFVRLLFLVKYGTTGSMMVVALRTISPLMSCI